MVCRDNGVEDGVRSITVWEALPDGHPPVAVLCCVCSLPVGPQRPPEVRLGPLMLVACCKLRNLC